ncbi:MAG: TetR/AcrR family transcriptional regulator [Eubacteriales bacterium]|nr:TetR/AcrR family transcriptional regulator [Eubacteriales bacterium]
MEQSKKELILENAFNSFVEKGYENTNIRELCKSVKVEPPTIYYYFQSKKGLFFAIVENLIEKYKARLKESDIFQISTEPENKLYELLRFNLKYSVENPKDLKFFIRYNLFPPYEVSKKLKGYLSLFRKDIFDLENKIFDECYQKGLISQERIGAVRNVFNMFVANHCYDTVMFGYCPSDDELPTIWEYFVKYKILSS